MLTISYTFYKSCNNKHGGEVDGNNGIKQEDFEKGGAVTNNIEEDSGKEDSENSAEQSSSKNNIYLESLLFIHLSDIYLVVLDIVMLQFSRAKEIQQLRFQLIESS